MFILNIIVLTIVLGVLFTKYEYYKPITKTNFLRFIISVIVSLLKIIVVFWLLWLVVGFSVLTNTDAPSPSSCPKEKMSCTWGYRKALGVINQAIMMDKQLEGTDIGNCTNDNVLAEIFMSRFNIKESYKAPNKRTFELLAKNKLSDKPYMIFVDDVLLIIDKVNGKCGSTKSSNPDEANCVVTVDVNGIKPPNELSTGNQEVNYKFKDRYQVIILKDKAIPASNSENNIADSIINKK